MDVSKIEQPISNICDNDVKMIISKCGYSSKEIESYSINNASDKMLGFLSDYWKLKVQVAQNKQVLSFFIKAISITNKAKADMVNEMKLFEKELYFYSVIQNRIEISGISSWSAKLVTALDAAMVFEDLNAKQFECRNKFKRFDMAHTLQALRTLARFHASTLIYEEYKSKVIKRCYRINDDHERYLNMGGYHSSSSWFIQCMEGALEAIKTFSMYTIKDMSLIEGRWSDIWNSALALSNFSSDYRNVICHRDLWNNNILFHYKEITENYYEPDDCLLVDFQAVRCQPPAGDVMLLLYCNLDPKFREENMQTFLNFYIDELHMILQNHDINANDIISKEDFLTSAQDQRKWGLVVCACLMPQFWLDDDLTTKTFCDTAQFETILTRNKASFINKMMQTNDFYREKVMEIFEEIVVRYCLKN